MKERKEEKRVPSSYLESLASTLSKMTTNWNTGEGGAPGEAKLQTTTTRLLGR